MILFAEVPNFYAEVERSRDPTLRDRPVVVGGDPRKRGVVQSASREARAAGVRVGMPMQQALATCPAARPVKTDMKHYREVSGRLRACLRAEVEAVEPVALESAYLDVSLAGEDARAVADRLTSRVKQTLGLPLRVGIAASKALARLAAEEAAPGRSRRVEPGEETEFLSPLPVDRLPGVGPRTLETLLRLGASTVGDLLRVDPARIERELGNHGLRILALASGREDSTVRGHRHPRTLSREHTFRPAEVDLGELSDCLQRLAQLLGEGLQEQGLCARRLGVKVRFEDQQTKTRSRTLSSPVSTAAEIYDVTVGLLGRTEAGARGVRVLGVTVSGLGPRPLDRQLELFR